MKLHLSTDTPLTLPKLFVICDMIKRNESDVGDIGKERGQIILFFIVFSTDKLHIDFCRFFSVVKKIDGKWRMHVDSQTSGKFYSPC